ncbi:DUF3967 domain-containing protein [Bacillus sp. SJS]|uniref:DUF3967 domain-containing protein n=1 Tax=Bacillus sp. SJS TaxID=1423321 RepID=UPI0004DCB376|nr:DUF3967 domain-containing protein [Bacillus sp. SJS]KZZ82527.1 hypothetical protein AS29_020775 [Bacillus sp. SJS]
MEQYEKAFTPKEVSLTLDVGDSTLRKWCISLESAGYKFMRSEQNKRLFIEGDLTVLKHLKELVQNHNMQINNASIVIVDRFGKGSFSPRTGIVPAEKTEEHRDDDRSNDRLISVLMDHIEQQKDFNQALVKRLDEQQSYIEDSLKKRDELLMKSIRESQETKKLIATAKEEHEKQPDLNNKKTFWDRVFGR